MPQCVLIVALLLKWQNGVFYSYDLILSLFTVFSDTCHNSSSLHLLLDLPFVIELSTVIKHIIRVKISPVDLLGQQQTRSFSTLTLPQVLIKNAIVFGSFCVSLQKNKMTTKSNMRMAKFKVMPFPIPSYIILDKSKA